jgi:serine/threonine-protein kinase
MEYIAGGSLEQFWRSHGKQFVPVGTAVELMRQVCRGLAVAHSERPPIIHRDIKPQNILVGYDANGLRARVSDFGLAKRVNPLTLMASAKGTRCFKSPEVFLDYQSDSCAGDVWALGSTLYLMLTDRLPFSESGDMECFDGSSFERPMVPCSQLNLHVDAVLDQILYKALAIKPTERYPTALALLEDLERWKPAEHGKAAHLSKEHLAAGMAKSALGSHSPVNPSMGEKMAAQALKLARENGKLIEAADLMEEAFNKWPELRKKYEFHLQVWRRGLSM